LQKENNMEIELKLLLTPQAVQSFRTHSLLKKYGARQPREEELSGTYYDTSNCDLRRAGAGLRVRQVDGRWVQTMKAGGGVASGLHSRHEWESPVAGPTPDLAVLRELVDHGSSWNKLLRSRDVEQGLLPVFTTSVTRTIWDLRLAEGTEIECVLDQGSLERGKDKEAICEIELELKSGDVNQLYGLALELLASIPMQIGNASKAERGYALLAPVPARAVKAETLVLSRHMNIEKAFQLIATNCMAQIQANEDGVMHRHDPESLHQMRVGIRRLRSAFSLFGSVLQVPDDMREDLNWIATQLGAARDWDVLADSTLSRLADAPMGAAQVGVVQYAAQKRAQHLHGEAAAAVASPRYTRLVLRLSQWMHACGWREAPARQASARLHDSVIRFADNMLDQLDRKLRKRGRRLHKATPEARHRARIAAKKARYAAEFFQSLYNGRKLRRYVNALSRLQDELGYLNDAAVADRLLQDLHGKDLNLAGGVGFVRGYLSRSAATDAGVIRKRWKKFNRLSTPW
jgi:inorganic triphosphatase YgiF